MNKSCFLPVFSRSPILYLLVVVIFATSSCQTKQKKDNNTLQETELVDVLSIDSSFVIDLKYATEENFLQKPVYKTQKCYLLKPAALMLSEANSQLKKHGLKIKIFDGYRPHSVQKLMWELVPNSMYVADPAKGSSHNRGCAVDVTLVDSLGNELLMPTGFDDFTEKAHHDFMDLPEEAIKNRELLKKIMVDAGFIPLQSEWWHYSTPGCSDNEILDMPL